VLGPHLSTWIGNALGAKTIVKIIWYIAEWPLLVAGLLVAFAGLMYYGPNVKHPRWRFLTFGAVFALLIWLGASGAFAFYVSKFGSYNKTWGSLSAVIVMLTWLWLTGLALLFGAEVNAEAERSRELLESTLGFATEDGASYEARGDSRGSFYIYDAAPEPRGLGGSGTVHHVAWSSTMEDHRAWREKVIEGGADPTPIIDRFYFRSIYFREPSGVLFEIATMGPGFAADESKDHLGERLSLPPAFEHLRAQVEANLTPLTSR